MALLLAMTAWWHSAQELPVVRIPTPKVPNPNAFDTFNAAAAQLLDTNKIMNAISNGHHSGVKDDRNYTWEEKQKLVSENAAALGLLRQGLNQEYANPPSRSFFTLMPYYAPFRATARLLALDASVREKQGDYAGAVRCDLDAIELGEKIPHGSTLIGGLVGSACQAIGRRPMWKSIDHLSAEQARTAASRLERIRQGQVPYAVTIQEEKWAGQAGLLEMLRHPGSIPAMMQQAGVNSAPASATLSSLSQLMFLVYSKQRIVNDYTKYMDAQIESAKRPYGATGPVAPPNDPLIAMVVTEFDRSRMILARNETQNGLMEISTALRAFRAEHGHYPNSLAELTPSILPALPADPFARGGSFGYRAIGDKYVLYSIGPDGKDDGGKAIDTGSSRRGNPNERYLVNEDSKGDVVAGKNVW